MLAGRMMNFPLTLTHFLERSKTFFGKNEIVSRLPDRSLHRTNYGELYKRACKLASALKKLGVEPGDRVATLCWNHYRHLEAYLGVPAMGAVIHTLNLRLHPTDIAYIASHAEDTIVIVDQSLMPLFSKFRDQVASIKHVIVVPDAGPAPEGTLDYEALLEPEPDHFAF